MIYQNDVLELIRDNTPDGCSFWFTDRNLKVIEEEIGWKPKNVLRMLYRLRKKGLLKRWSFRTFVLPEKWDEFMKR
jgi:DNA-binding MarR family transcriptional regulator